MVHFPESSLSSNYGPSVLRRIARASRYFFFQAMEDEVSLTNCCQARIGSSNLLSITSATALGPLGDYLCKSRLEALDGGKRFDFWCAPPRSPRGRFDGWQKPRNFQDLALEFQNVRGKTDLCSCKGSKKGKRK